MSLAAIRIQSHTSRPRSARHLRHGRRAVLHGSGGRHVGGAAAGDSGHGPRQSPCWWRDAFLSKLSGPILVPIAAAMLAVRLVPAAAASLVRVGRRTVEHRRPRPAAGGPCRGARSSLAWWRGRLSGRPSASATARSHAARPAKDAFLGQVTDQPGLGGWLLATARQFHLLPEAYIYGLGLTVQFASERASFLNGQFGTTGWWWYFPYAFSVKTTMPGMIAGVLALAALVARWRTDPTWPCGDLDQPVRGHAAALSGRRLFGICAHHAPEHRSPASAADLPGAVHSGGRGGVLDPADPATRGKTRTRRRGRDRRKQRSQARAAAPDVAPSLDGSRCRDRGRCSRGTSGESVTIRPNYLAYFNQLAGGPSQGYKHLADSSLDWGQDLPALKQWLDREGLQRPGTAGVYLSVLRYRTTRVTDGIQATMLRRVHRSPSATTASAARSGCLLHQRDCPRRHRARCSTSLTTRATIRQALQEPDRLRARLGERASKAALVQQMGGGILAAAVRRRCDQMRTGTARCVRCAQRQPDAMIGYSILIFRLSDDDVRKAVGGA